MCLHLEGMQGIKDSLETSLLSEGKEGKQTVWKYGSSNDRGAHSHNSIANPGGRRGEFNVSFKLRQISAIWPSLPYREKKRKKNTSWNYAL